MEPGVRYCANCGAAVETASPATPGAPPPPPPPPPAPAPVGPPAAFSTPAPESGRSKRALYLAIGAGVVLILVAASLALVGGDEDTPEAEIFLEPVAFLGDDPFSDSVDTHTGATTETTQPVINTTAPPEPTDSAPAVGVNGNAPGLYGGTRDNATCSPDQLVEFLVANADKARAWAGVLDIAADAIPAYVDGLTPVILQRDTRVTNHGFRNGRATTLQSVLQAGTAVMVDRFGVPRVKCGCGNPLTEPTTARRPAYQGTQWPGFTPANIVVVNVNVEVNVFVLVDVGGGEPFSRPTGTTGETDGEIVVDEFCDMFPDDPDCGVGPGDGPGEEPTLGTGDVQVTLRWFSTADLDLAVTDPTGQTVSYSTPSVPTGGTLDVDSNGGCGDDVTTSPVENVYWPEGTAPDGDYLITVDYYGTCDGGEGTQAYELTFFVGGQAIDVTPAMFGGGVRVELVGGRVAGVVPVAPGQTVEGALEPGASVSYLGTKPPGTLPPPEDEVPPDDEAPPGDDAPPPAETDPCAEYPEGSMERTLCEHDPTINDVSGEDDSGLPQPAD